MRLIYDAGSNQVATCEGIVFRGGRVTGDIDDTRAKAIIAQPHLKIRAATPAEIKAKDAADNVVAVAAGEEPTHTEPQLRRMNKDELIAIADALEIDTEGLTKDDLIVEIIGNQP